MKFYNDSYSAWSEFRYNSKEIPNLSESDRKNLLIALFNNPEYTYYFITYKYYVSDNELLQAINVCLQYPTWSIKLLVEKNELLNDTQRQKAFNDGMSKWDGIQLLFKNNMLDDIQRMEAIKILSISITQIERLLRNNILYNNELEFIFGILPTDLLQYSNIVKIILAKQTVDTTARRKIFVSLIPSKNTVYDFASNNRFLKHEIQIVHDIYWGDLFAENKRSYTNLLQYCKTFISVLNNTELDYLVKRLIGNKKAKDITEFAENKHIPEVYRDKLHAFIVISKLKTGY